MVSLFKRGPKEDNEPEQDDLGRMTLVEHLTELRKRLVICVFAIAVGAIIAFAGYSYILDFLKQPYCDVLPPERECNFVLLNPLEGFSTRIRVAGFSGLFLGAPVVLWHIWRFITPGLHKKEKRYAIPFVLSSMVLFTLGGAVAIITFPRALEFLVAVGGESSEPFYSPSGYIRLVTLMIFAFGLAFEFPIVLVFLELAGVVTSAKLRKLRRAAIVTIVVIAAVITPSQDPISLFAMAGPMYIFYEISILIGRVLKK